MQEIDKLRAERNAVASAMKGKLDLARREELIEQGSISQFVNCHKEEEISFFYVTFTKQRKLGFRNFFFVALQSQGN